jgi:hypothetical protein
MFPRRAASWASPEKCHHDRGVFQGRNRMADSESARQALRCRPDSHYESPAQHLQGRRTRREFSMCKFCTYCCGRKGIPNPLLRSRRHHRRRLQGEQLSSHPVPNLGRYGMACRFGPPNLTEAQHTVRATACGAGHTEPSGGADAEVCKDLRGPLLKHYWPENPLEAEATRGVRRRT